MQFSILVVDDDFGLRELLRQMLEFSGFEVEEAVDGLDALDKIGDFQPDLLVLDVMMPQMDGITLCKRLRAEPETAVLPIIMLSGKTQREAIKEGLTAGANKYLTKPMSFEHLIQSINELLPQPIS